MSAHHEIVMAWQEIYIWQYEELRTQNSRARKRAGISRGRGGLSLITGVDFCNNPDEK